MAYVICDNEGNYIHRSKSNYFSIVKDIKEATKWPSKIKADNACAYNCGAKELRKFLWVVKNASEVIVKDEISEESAHTSEVLEVNIIEKINELSKFATQLEIRKTHLVTELSNVDMEITDIEHAAEFYSLNASQGYKLYRLLHDARIRRRKIKDELQRIDIIKSHSINITNICDLEKCIQGVDSKKYTPRINKELFKGESL